MKISRQRTWLVLGVMLVSALLSGLYVRDMETTMHQTTTYLTIGIDQSGFQDDPSFHEVQQAEEHFSDMVLGWSVAPDFRDEFGEFETSYSARRQEKQNLIFTFDSPDHKVTAHFVDLLRERIEEYNTATSSTYVIARESHTNTTQHRSALRVFLGWNALVFILILTSLFCFEYIHSNRCRS